MDRSSSREEVVCCRVGHYTLDMVKIGCIEARRVWILILRILSLSLLAPMLTVLSATPSQATLADCMYLGDTSSNLTSSKLTIRATVYSSCTEAQIKTKNNSGNGLDPLYSVPNESGLFDLLFIQCNGPSLLDVWRGIGPGKGLGQVVCTIPVGSSTFSSSRVGATSTAIRAWFAWDFSAKSISISHSPIPSKSSWDSGNSPGSGSGSVTIPTVVKPCLGPPVMPNLKITYTNIGTRFEVQASPQGELANSIYWAFTLFDDTKRTWGEWSTTTRVSGNSHTHEVKETPGFSRIAFSAQSGNPCGISASSRENAQGNGVLLAKLIQDELIATSTANNLYLTVDTLVSSRIKSSTSSNLVTESLTPEVCEIRSTSISPRMQGVCRIRIQSKSDQAHIISAVRDFEFNVVKAESFFVHNLPKKGKAGKTINIITHDRAGQRIQLKIQTAGSCKLSKYKLKLLKQGTCNVTILAEETDSRNSLSKTMTIAITRK